MRKILAIMLTAVMLIGTLGLTAFAAEPTVVTNWSNTGFEGVNDEANGLNDDLAYVIHTGDSTFWQAVVDVTGGTGKNSIAKIDQYNFICTINGTDYTAKTVSVWISNETSGYMRFVLTDTGFIPSFGATYSVSWKVEAKDGSAAWTGGDAIDVVCMKGEKPAGEALTAEETAAIMAMTALNDKIDQNSIKLDDVSQSNIFNPDTESVAKLFDGKYTEAEWTKFGTHNATNVTVTWSYTEAVTVTNYVLVTGNDTAGSPSRNPIVIKLYGSNDGSEWTLIDSVGNADMAVANHTPCGFNVDTPAAYTSYQIVMTSENQLQLDELLTYNDPNYTAEQPDNNEQPDTNEQTTPDTNPVKPAPTGDVITVLIAVSAVAMAAIAIAVSKKRNAAC
ncbi:MAG: hypothetical protein IJX47_01420 [Clostridia bacterium]|nr:hypothetical protein [Clostridia bacterium]